MHGKKTNIVLIGMAGSGKSSTGPLLAKALAMEFVDTDDLISSTRNLPLQQIIDHDGQESFRILEEQVLCGLELENHVLATGGSAIYSRSGMEHLRRHGLIVYLDLPLAVLLERIDNISSRGLVKREGQSFDDLYQERKSLYEQYAEIRVDCEGKSREEVCGEIVKEVQARWQQAN
jgi:shikimate kinase